MTCHFRFDHKKIYIGEMVIDMKIKPKYFIKSETPLLYYHFLTKFSLFVGIVLSVLLSIAYGLNGQILMCLLSVANVFLCAFSVNLLLRMEWRGVQVLLGGYIFGLILRTGILVIFEAQGIPLARVLSEFLASFILLILNWVYFCKRRPLFKPYSSAILQTQIIQNLPENTMAQQAEPQPIVFVYRSNFKSKNAEPIKIKWKFPRTRRGVIASIAISLVLLIGISGSAYGIVQGISLQNAKEEIESLQHDKSVLKGRITEQSQEIQRLQRDMENYNDKMNDFYTFVEESAFLRNSIGFIVEGSPYYHSYRCSTFQNANEYWAHNIEYCQYLGYSQCPYCW